MQVFVRFEVSRDLDPCALFAVASMDRNMPWRPGTKRGRHEQVADLPLPLFTLYCQLEAYCDSVLTGKLLLMFGAGGELGVAAS